MEGVDISNGMIQLARESEAEQPLGLAYHVEEVDSTPVLIE